MGSEFHGLFKSVCRSVKEVPKEFQRGIKRVSRKFPGCLSKVSMMFQKKCQSWLRDVQRCFKDLKWCFREIPRVD